MGTLPGRTDGVSADQRIKKGNGVGGGRCREEEHLMSGSRIVHMGGAGTAHSASAPTAAECVRLLKDQRAFLTTRFGVVAIALFGSTARGEAGADSDIDVLVTLDGKPGWQYACDLQMHLEELFGRRVDLVLDTELRPEFRPDVEAEAIYV